MKAKANSMRSIPFVGIILLLSAIKMDEVNANKLPFQSTNKPKRSSMVAFTSLDNLQSKTTATIPMKVLPSSKDDLDHAITIRGGGYGMSGSRNGNAINDNDATKAKVSWYCDVLWCVANIIFLSIWLLAPDKYFDESFRNAGFCIHPTHQLKSNPTMLECFRFDIIATILALVLGVAGRLPFNFNTIVSWSNGVAYPLCHGIAHFAIYLNLIDPQQTITWNKHIEVIALSAILAMGPLSVYSNIKTKYPNTKTQLRLIIPLLIEILLVCGFVMGVKNGVYALLYINVAVNLCIMASRLFLFGFETKDDIQYRLVTFGPLFYLQLLTVSLVILVMWIEPTQCEAWFSNVGGHVWFDAALFLMGIVAFANTIIDNREPPPKPPKVMFY